MTDDRAVARGRRGADAKKPPVKVALLYADAGRRRQITS